MARGDQLARQWRIIQTLVSSKHGKTVADLVKEENCHSRTIYRDLEALQEAFGSGARKGINGRLISTAGVGAMEGVSIVEKVREA